MKHIFILILAALAAPAFGQKKFIENRNGQAVIVTRDTFPTGETTETVMWKANPTAVLEGDLKETQRLIDWTEAKIQSLQIDLKRLYQDKSETEKALDDLAKGLIIDDGTGKTAAPPAQPAPASKSTKAPSPKKVGKKKKKQ